MTSNTTERAAVERAITKRSPGVMMFCGGRPKKMNIASVLSHITGETMITGYSPSHVRVL